MRTQGVRPMPQEPGISERQLTGDDIIAEILRNIEAGQFRVRRTTLLPCIFHIYLHPSDYDAIRPVMGVITAEARSALKERAEELNKRAEPSRVRKLLGFDDGEPTRYKIADPDWTIEFYPDLEEKLGRSDIEIHSDLASTPRPEFEGAETRHVTRRPAGAGGTEGSEATAAVSRIDGEVGKSYAWLRYTDKGGDHTFAVARDEIVLGRGGKAVWVDVKLDAPPDVSREHCRIRRDAASGRFFLKDLSQFGTTLDGRRVPSSIERRGQSERDINVEVEIPPKATLRLADVVTVEFEAAGA